MRLELAQSLEALPENADPSRVRPYEQALGSSAEARHLVALEELAGLVIGERDLGDFEEVERLPLEVVSVAYPLSTSYMGSLAESPTEIAIVGHCSTSVVAGDALMTMCLEAGRLKQLPSLSYYGQVL